jgi:ATP-dependent DNA helicase DinG
MPGRFRALASMGRPLLPDAPDRKLLDGLNEVADRLVETLDGCLGARVLRPGGPVAGTTSPRVARSSPGSDAVAPEPEGLERALPDTAPRRASTTRGGERGGGDRGGGERGGGERGGRGGGGDRGGASSDDPDAAIEVLLDLATSRVQDVMSALRRGHSARSSVPFGDGGSTGSADDTARQARALSAGGHLADDLARFAARTDDEVAWVDGTPRLPVLHLSPIDVGPPLAGVLWGEVTAVLTSATIPPRLSERLGLAAFPVDVIDVGSPFDYRNHGLLYVARHLPDRRSPDAEPALHDELEALIGAAGGRTLALFTSRRATDAAVTVLRERVRYRLLAQGDLPKNRLLATFAEDEQSCLFATLGFWQGVDIPGRSLSLVTVDKLPFARPDDPLLEARRERAGAAALRLVDLPRAAPLLAQGAGRLIRTSEDRGVVAVLDPRLATAGYRAVLLSAMPPMRRTTDRRQVVDFLRRSLA